MAQVHIVTRDHKEFLNRQRSLRDLAASGSLTKAALDAEMVALYDDGDYIDRSIGFAWLSENVQMFKSVADRCGFSVQDFLVEHGGIYWVGNRYLLSPELLKLIAADRREQFVCDIYRKHGAFNSGWIRVVLDLGIRRDTIAALIIEGLKKSAEDAEDRCLTSEARDFIEYGPGVMHAEFSRELFDSDEMFRQALEVVAAANPWTYVMFGKRVRAKEPSPWAVLNDEQFLEAMQVCALKAPWTFVRFGEKVRGRLGDDEYFRLARGTVLGLAKLRNEQRTFVQSQPVEFQNQVAETLAEGAEFFIGLASRLPKEQGLALLRKKAEVLASVNVVNLYTATWSERHLDGKPVAAWVEDYFTTRLATEGYVVGTVQRSQFTPKGKQPRTQLTVTVSSEGRPHKYVHDRYSRYQPSDGERVFVSTRSPGNVKLRSDVTATTFSPAGAQENRPPR